MPSESVPASSRMAAGPSPTQRKWTETPDARRMSRDSWAATGDVLGGGADGALVASGSLAELLPHPVRTSSSTNGTARSERIRGSTRREDGNLSDNRIGV